MKTKIVSMIAATVLLKSALNAGQGYISAGYANVNIEGVVSTGVSIDVGTQFGETFKQKLGTKYILVSGNDKHSNDKQNMGDIYYSLGFEVFPSTIIAANIGFAYQDIGSIGTRNNKTTVYATGLSYGATLTYDIIKHFDVALCYTKSDLNYDTLNYTVDVIDASIAYKF